MHELAKVLVSMPSDLRVEVSVYIEINEDVPNLFVEDTDYKGTEKTLYTRVIDAKDGIITKSISIYMHD